MSSTNVLGNLYVISGPSGVGKDTLVALIFDEIPQLCSSVSVTSRPSRPGEVEGVHYYFMDFDKVQSMIDNNELIEWNKYAGNLYGTPKKYVEETLAGGRDILFSIDVHGAVNIKKNYPQAKLIFIDAPSKEELRDRLIKRGANTEEEIYERLNLYDIEKKYRNQFDVCIINDNLSTAKNQVIDFIKQSSKISTPQ